MEVYMRLGTRIHQQVHYARLTPVQTMAMFAWTGGWMATIGLGSFYLDKRKERALDAQAAAPVPNLSFVPEAPKQSGSRPTIA